MKLINTLFSKGDISNGETIYFVDKQMNNPFNGIAYEEYADLINSVFDVKNGKKDGIEKLFHENSKVLQQITEYRKNLQFGVSKEYDEHGKENSVSIIWNNEYLKILTLSNGSIVDREDNFDLRSIEYPSYILELLNLDDKALIVYPI
ncbi:hypothetical protein ABIB40_003659 [Pedobacter sp. UYP30]|uniref:hypothetical protein n=1 Tax=Pedobacter sp. UYP30 TaxID=1756400 RepID=UPI003397E1F0